METRTNFFTRLIILLLLVLGVGGSAWAETYTLGWGTASGSNFTNFTATSGSVSGILSFTTAKNGAGSAPAYNASNSELRLYYGSGGNGGSITITPASGITITGAVITTSTSPTVKYKVDGGSATSVTVSSNTYTISGISAESSLEIQNCNTTNTQLRIKTIQITYTTSVPSISMKGSTSIEIGGTETLEPTIKNSGGATVNWTTDNSDIVSLDGGTTGTTKTIRGVAIGGPIDVTARFTVGSTTYSATCAVTVTKKAPTITLDDSEMSLTVGGSTQTRTATTNSGGDITYSSSNTSVATVNRTTGEVSPVGKGSCTITANVAETSSYAAGNKSYPVKVIGPTKVYQKVTSAGELETGKKYILVYENGSSTRVMGAVDSYGASVDGFTITDNKITVTGDKAVNVLTLSAGTMSTNYAFKTEIEDAFLSWSSGNSLATYTGEVPMASSSWNLSYSGTTLTITNYNTTDRKLQYNSGSPRFACYTTSQQAVALYKEYDTSPSYDMSMSDVEVEMGSYVDNPASVTPSTTITYESDDTDVATVSPTGRITGVAPGTATITATAAAATIGGKSYPEKSVTCTVTVKKLAQTVTFDNGGATVSIVEGKTNTNVATTTGNGAITYKSSKTSVATVDASGKVTAVSMGTCTITATAAETSTYAQATASYVVNVTTSSYFKKVTSSEDIGEGEYLIVYESSDAAGKALDASLGTEIDKTNNTIDVSIADEKIAATEETMQAVLTFERDGSNYNMKSTAGYYVYANYKSSLYVLDASNTPSAQIVTYTGGVNKNVTIVDKNYDSGGHTVYLKYATGSTRFRYYTSGAAQDICLYKKVVVEVEDEDISFPISQYTMQVGSTYTQTAQTKDPAAVVTYSSSNPSVAIVNSTTGEVTALTEGITTITGTITATGKSAT